LTVVVDSNIAIAALIKNGIVRSTVFKRPGFWITPESCFDEIWEHRDVWNRNHLPDREPKSILDDFVEDYVILISRDVYADKIGDATHLVDDKDDVGGLRVSYFSKSNGLSHSPFLCSSKSVSQT